MATTHLRSEGDRARGRSPISTSAPPPSSGCTARVSAPEGTKSHLSAPACWMAPRLGMYSMPPPCAAAAATAGARAAESRGRSWAGSDVGGLTAPRAMRHSPPLTTRIPRLLVLRSRAKLDQASSFLRPSPTPSASLKTSAAPATGDDAPPRPAPASLRRREMVGVAMHSATSAAATSSVRPCASLTAAPTTAWFTARRVPPRNPMARGMSRSSKPGIPRVNRNTAMSSTSCMARIESPRRAWLPPLCGLACRNATTPPPRQEGRSSARAEAAAEGSCTPRPALGQAEDAKVDT
mmetsp:Transcript_62174/g.196693  ORF Transcript_62174/g.196693 Transcript_62174/m.196693 type:complete len:294 (+) Transcript_62174:187-1068(+)